VEELEGQAAPEGEAPEAAPQQTIDLNAALARVAEEYGMPSPDYVQDALRLQDENRRVFEENRRRDQELRQRERELAERRQPDPLPEEIQSDPYRRDLHEVKTTLKQLMDERRAEREYQETVNQMGTEFNSAYQSLARQNGLTKEQIEAGSEGFYDALTELYPKPGMIQEVGVEHAARMAWRHQRGQGGTGNGYQPSVPRGPRTPIIIPAGNSSPSALAAGPDLSPRKPGETIEQYTQRVEHAGRILQNQLRESGPGALPERYSSG